MAKYKSKSIRLLFKRALKSTFSNKVFSILMFFLIFISGATYTTLESTSSSFSKSFDSVVNAGRLHDYVIKENFKIDEDKSSINFYLESKDGTRKPIDTKSISDPINHVSSLSINGQIRHSLKIVVDQATGDFEYLKEKLKDGLILTFNTDKITPQQQMGDWTEELKYVQEEINSHISTFKIDAESRLSTKFIKGINLSFHDEFVSKETRSLSVSYDVNSFKVVEYNDSSVNNLYMYSGTNNFSSPLTESELLNELYVRLQEDGIDPSQYSIDTLKRYQVSASNNTTKSYIVEDPSSYQAIVSPAYANANEKKCISPIQALKWAQDPSFINERIAKRSSGLTDEWSKYMVWADNTPFFIIGIGTTPDFIYPIIDEKHPSINVKNQGIIYTNSNGYARILNGFRTNLQENYISILFKDRVSQDRRQEIVAELDQIARTGSSISLNKAGINSVPISHYPKNIAIVTSRDDNNDQSLLTQERVSFLQKLSSTIHTLSIVTTSMLIIFVLAIVTMVFQVLIIGIRKSLSTLVALGYSRSKIAFSNTIVSIIFGALPAIVGYIVGYVLQFVFINQFSNYWTIPTYGSSFSFISLLVVVVFPLVSIGFLIFVITFRSLSHPIPNMLNDSVNSNNAFISRVTSKLGILSVKGKYAVALTLKNTGKLLLTTMAAAVAMSALIVGVSSVGRANVAYNSTVAMTNFAFQIDLYSPTLEGGNYKTIQKNSMPSVLPKVETYQAKVDSSNPNSVPIVEGKVDLDKPHWHIPSTADANLGLPYQALRNPKLASTYLKNKLQTKSLLTTEIGGLSPWNIAERLMPENQKNIANQNYLDLDKDQLLSNAISNEEKIKILNDNIINSDKQDYHMPYIISYQDVIIDNTDETYTYVDSKYKNENLRIIGLNEATNMINLRDKLPLLLESNDNFPIFINKYLASHFSLDKGDTLELQVLNHVDRNRDNEATRNVKAKIIDIVDGYNESGIYTLQSIANKVIGLSELPQSYLGTSTTLFETPFNGVFSQKVNPVILNTLPLYSPSGLFLGTDTINGPWENVLNTILSDKDIWKYKDIAADSSHFFEKYSRTPFVAATNSVSWKEIEKFTFKNISHLSTTLLIIIESISIALSIIFAVIVTSLLLTTNKKKIAALWALGFRKNETIRIFLVTNIIPLFLSLIFSIWISKVILTIMRIFVMNFGHILIPFSLTIYAPFIGVIIIATIFILSTCIAIMRMKNNTALKAFKGD